jgi:tetratricopeptide (TPR) repeat protein
VRSGGRDSRAAAAALAEADGYRAGNDWPRAVQAYQRAAAADPQEYRAAYGLAFACRANGDLAGAVRACQKACDLGPTQPDAAYLLALCAHEYRNSALASQVLEQALARWPGYAALFELAARVRYDQRRYAEARAYGEYFVEIAPASPTRQRFADWVRRLPAR